MVNVVDVTDRSHDLSAWVFSTSTDVDVENDELRDLLTKKDIILGVSEKTLIFWSHKRQSSTNARQMLCRAFNKVKCGIGLEDVSHFSEYHAELFGFKEISISEGPRIPVPALTWIPREPTELELPKGRRLTTKIMKEWVFLKVGQSIGHRLRYKPHEDLWPIFWAKYSLVSSIKDHADRRREAVKVFLDHCGDCGRLHITKDDLSDNIDDEWVDGKCRKCKKDMPKSTDLLSCWNEPPLMSNLGPIFKNWMYQDFKFSYTVPGPGLRRFRRVTLCTTGTSVYAKKKALFNTFCGPNCARGRCRKCGLLLETDDRGRCTTCKNNQRREWVELYGFRNIDMDPDLPVSMNPLEYNYVKKGGVLEWPWCEIRNPCPLHRCRHICTRNCKHECSSLDCRFVPMTDPDKEYPLFGEGECTCNPEWIEAFDFSKQFRDL
jgi:hypothetical protein